MELEPEIKVLRAKARDRLPDCVVQDGSRYDKTNDDGDKIKEVPIRGSGKTFDTNVSSTFRPTPSTTDDVDLLVLEAEMAAGDEYELGNPHIPRSVEARDQALKQIQANGHKPAWEQ